MIGDAIIPINRWGNLDNCEKQIAWDYKVIKNRGDIQTLAKLAPRALSVGGTVVIWECFCK